VFYRFLRLFDSPDDAIDVPGPELASDPLIPFHSKAQP
jgi:hypothetical protein